MQSLSFSFQSTCHYETNFLCSLLKESFLFFHFLMGFQQFYLDQLCAFLPFKSIFQDYGAL
jgi:hypothetical protein